LNELESGLCGRTSAFALIAGLAARDDVLPAFFPALYDGNDVIKRELRFWEVNAAVLALVSISKENVRARKAHEVLFLFDGNVLQESKHGRSFDRDAHGAYFEVTLFDDFHFALKQKLNGALPRHDVEGLERRIEDEGLSTGHTLSIPQDARAAMPLNGCHLTCA
jgi:hypothetical protein